MKKILETIRQSDCPCILTDSMSWKVISAGIDHAEVSYERITGKENIREFLIEIKENLTSKLKREGYSYGLKMLTGFEFPVTSDIIVDAPYDSVVINIGTTDNTRANPNEAENWDKGFIDPELRVIYIKKVVD